MAGSREGAGGKKGVQAEVNAHEAPRVGRSSGHRGRESKGEVPTRSESSGWGCRGQSMKPRGHQAEDCASCFSCHGKALRNRCRGCDMIRSVSGEAHPGCHLQNTVRVTGLLRTPLQASKCGSWCRGPRARCGDEQRRRDFGSVRAVELTNLLMA